MLRKKNYDLLLGKRGKFGNRKRKINGKFFIEDFYV